MSATLQEIMTELDALYAQGRQPDAVAYLDEAVQTVCKVYGARSRAYASILNEVGALHRGLGDQARAEQAFREAAGLLLELGCGQTGDYATTINNLAGVYRLTGQYSQAAALFQECLRLYDETLGQRHPLYASACNNLALLFQDQNQPEQAARWHMAALKILESRDDAALEYATSLYNLGLCCHALGDVETARELVSNAAARYEQCLPQTHPLRQEAARMQTLLGATDTALS